VFQFEVAIASILKIFIIVKLPKKETNYIRQKYKKLNNLKTNKPKQILNEQIEESNRLRHMHHEGQLQI
jgi:hypothetical protein